MTVGYIDDGSGALLADGYGGSVADGYPYGFIDDGAGGYIADGIGGYIEDGYLVAGPSARAARWLAFTEPDFPGRRPRQVAAPAVPPLSTAPLGDARRRLLSRHFTQASFEGRAPRPSVDLPSDHPGCTSPTYISDGYGALIADGYGSYLVDGYCGAVPATLPFNPFRPRAFAQFRLPTFQGRTRQHVSQASTRPSPPAALPYAATSRLLRILHDHFAEPPYPSRRQLRYAFAYGGGFGLPRHASQIVAEALTHAASPGARASQLVAEVLNRDSAGARASQIIAEALYRQDEPSFVRVSQFVLEALVPYLELPPVAVYPTLIGLTYKVVKRPKFSTGVGVASSGREVRVAYWSRPQWEWDLTYDILADNGQYTGTTASDIKTLIGFFLSVQGSWGSFYFLDPDDYEVTGQALGTGDGSTTTFEFIRTYGLGQFTGTEPVGGVNTAQTVNVYLNGVKQTTGFTINTSTPVGNYVQFTTAPAAGVVVTADFQFWYFCRLKDDSYDFDKIMNCLWQQEKITIFSTKN